MKYDYFYSPQTKILCRLIRAKEVSVDIQKLQNQRRFFFFTRFLTNGNN